MAEAILGVIREMRELREAVRKGTIRRDDNLPLPKPQGPVLEFRWADAHWHFTKEEQDLKSRDILAILKEHDFVHSIILPFDNSHLVLNFKTPYKQPHEFARLRRSVPTVPTTRDRMAVMTVDTNSMASALSRQGYRLGKHIGLDSEIQEIFKKRKKVAKIVYSVAVPGKKIVESLLLENKDHFEPLIRIFFGDKKVVEGGTEKRLAPPT